MMTTIDDELRQRIEALEAKDAIRSCLHLYCRGIDRRAPEIVRQVFWEDATVEYGMFAGTAVEFATSISSWFEAGGVGNTAHLLGNITIALDGSIAYTEAYLHAHHRLTNAKGTYYDSVFGGRYHDRFECRDGRWRIAFRRLVFDWFRDYPDTGDWDIGSMGVNRANATIGAPGLDVLPELNAALLGCARQL
jgi:hypothetical protein